MNARLLERRAGLPVATPQPRPAHRPQPDPGFEALPRLTRLRDTLTAAPVACRSPWNEPPLFFFDRKRQEQLATTRSAKVDPLGEIAEQIAAELPGLYASVEVRRVARAVEGLMTAAESLAARCSAAKELADLLAVPDDEVFLVLQPDERTGFRLVVRGVADVGQFHLLLADTITAGRVAERFVRVCRDVNPAVPAGVPMVAEARFQMYLPAAVRPNGTLPVGLTGCEHWLWPEMALAAVPRVKGERVVLLGPPAYRMTWDVTRRFPAMAAEVRRIETLSPARVAEYLTRFGDNAMPAIQPQRLPKAA